MSCCAGEAGWLVCGELVGVAMCVSWRAGDACSFAAGEVAGIDIPGVCVWGEAVVAGAVVGIGVLGVCSEWPPAAGITVGLADFDPRAAVFRFAFRFGAAFGFAFDLFMPGMLWPSCWANTGGAKTMQNKTTRDKITASLNSEDCLFITAHD